MQQELERIFFLRSSGAAVQGVAWLVARRTNCLDGASIFKIASLICTFTIELPSPQTFMLLSGSISAGTGYPSSMLMTFRVKAGPLAGNILHTILVAQDIRNSSLVQSGTFNRSWERRWKRVLKPYVSSTVNIHRPRYCLTLSPQKRAIPAHPASIHQVARS